METGREDSGREDSGREDSGREDSGREDSGREDWGREDSGREDSGREETRTRETRAERPGTNDRSGARLRGGRRRSRKRTGLDGALALVTGSGGGIGRETALALSERGSRVLVADIDPLAAKQTAADCGGTPYEIDVADRRGVLELAELIHTEHGPLDVLVNNAGVGMSGVFLDTTLEDWDWILGVNLLGVLHFCHAFGTKMVERRRGHVVNVSSGLGYVPTAGEPAYGTTKAAVLALSRGLRADWARSGVGVSVVCPGIIATSIIDHTRFVGDRASPETVNQVRQLFARRGHPPRLVARAILSAIERDRPVVPVGLEAWASWTAHGLVPSRLADKISSLAADLTDSRSK